MRAGRSPAFRLVTVLTALATCASACTSMHPVPVVNGAQPTAAAPIAAGDRVRVTMKNGQRAEFEVADVDEMAIVAHGGTRYPHDQIASLERRQFSGARTTGLIAAIGGVVLFALIQAAMAMGSILSDSP